MPQFYRRRILTAVAGLEIAEPRQTFDIERSSDPTQDRGSLNIWNLSEVHESRIRDRRGPITVQAGYPETLALIYEGQLQDVVRARHRLARITRITLGDRLREEGRRNAITNREYPGDVSIRSIAQDIVTDDMGLEVGPLDAIPEGATFPNFAWFGQSSAAALDALIRRVSGVHWSETDGVVRFHAEGKTQVDAPIIQLSPATGLIDSPIVTAEGAEIRCFLRPEIVLGCRIDLESDLLSGVWKVVELRHQGDSWQGQFETFCELREIEE